MSYPNADRDALANYYLASQQLQGDMAEAIAQLRAALDAVTAERDRLREALVGACQLLENIDGRMTREGIILSYTRDLSDFRATLARIEA